jgi:enoyl-CoA hydratase/carnithine racemase
MTTTNSAIQTHTANAVAHIRIARPEKKNAITRDMYQAMANGINAAVADTAVRSVLLYGEPAIFTAGNDLEDFLKEPPAGMDSPVFRFMSALTHCPKPVVVAVNGPAVGIGTTLLLHADLVYAADNAMLSMPFVTLGICAEFASSMLVPALCGTAKAAEKLLLGESMSAEEARDLGFITQVMAPEDVLPHAIRKAEKFASLPAGGVQATKKLMRVTSHASVDKIIEAEALEFGRLLRSAEAKEAMSAFFEKRKPNFAQFA